jgi:hypothetical protein
MGRSGQERVVQFGWENITAKVEDYYSFVIRRLAARDALPSGFSAEVPPAPERPAGIWSNVDLVGLETTPGEPPHDIGGAGAEVEGETVAPGDATADAMGDPAGEEMSGSRA